jgi:hypothetical protein
MQMSVIIKRITIEMNSLTLFGRSCTALQSEMLMNWILIQELLTKFTSEIHDSDSITIHLHENFVQHCCFATGEHLSPQKNQNTPTAVSGKQQVMTCFSLPI